MLIPSCAFSRSALARFQAGPQSGAPVNARREVVLRPAPDSARASLSLPARRAWSASVQVALHGLFEPRRLRQFFGLGLGLLWLSESGAV